MGKAHSEIYLYATETTALAIAGGYGETKTPATLTIAAREALKALPHSATTLILVGDVYANNPASITRA